nr:ISL3 family transposase [Loigolactobacillus backii]
MKGYEKTVNPIDNHIKFALSIKDPNVIFFDYGYEYKQNRRIKVYRATVKTGLERCPQCGFDQFNHNGHYLSRVTYLAANASEPVYLELHKERLLCKNCGTSVMATTELVDKYCNISRATRQKIFMHLQDDRTQKSIACDNNVSPSTVCRYLDKYDDLFRRNYNYLPEHLAMDEVRGVGSVLHFICINGAGDHEIQQILPDRLKQNIIAYFKQFPLSVRQRVKTVTLDLNSYYQDIVKVVFPNAKIIVDRFHIIAMMTRAFNQSRVQLMKQYSKRTKEYRILKFAWKLYLKHCDDLEVKQLFYDRHLRQQVTQQERVQLGLELDETLANTYTIMQGIMTCLKNYDKDGLVIYLYHNEQLSPKMKATLITFKKNLEIILNASESKYSNGPIEGINRMIKQIQRTAFGFRNYHHLVSRIKLQQMRTKPNKKTALEVA